MHVNTRFVVDSLKPVQAYGIYTPGGVLKAPFKESMVLPGPHARGSYYLRYYALEELLAEKSDGKSWTWCEVRPDAIVSHAIGSSGTVRPLRS